jgi:hypothetical protein
MERILSLMMTKITIGKGSRMTKKFQSLFREKANKGIFAVIFEKYNQYSFILI